ncbi:MAG: hypothetical protein PVF66_09385 [Candidatus Aminicenantes bacterium]|jgi:DNA-directed RNA polymerase subunit M/transcription elongation factor TFIIS
MNDCKKCQSLLLEALYKEMNAEQKHFFKEHLLVCEKCKSKFEEMKSTLQFMNKRVRPEPGKAFWDSYEEKLVQRIEKEEILQPERESWQKRFARAFTFAPKWAYQTAAALVLIVVGVFIGRMVFMPSTPEIQQASQQPGIVSPKQPGTELIHRTQNYIERSKLILLALVNFDPAIEDPYALDLPFQQQVSRELVQEASYLKRELAESDQKRLENLIVDLERVLLQIANLESENDFEAIDLIKEGTNSRGILMQINLADLRRSFQKRNESVPSRRPSTKPQIY